MLSSLIHSTVESWQQEWVTLQHSVRLEHGDSLLHHIWVPSEQRLQQFQRYYHLDSTQLEGLLRACYLHTAYVQEYNRSVITTPVCPLIIEALNDLPEYVWLVQSHHERNYQKHVRDAASVVEQMSHIECFNDTIWPEILQLNTTLDITTEDSNAYAIYIAASKIRLDKSITNDKANIQLGCFFDS